MALLARKRAIKKNIPEHFLSLADSYFNKGIYIREVVLLEEKRKKPWTFSHCYDRGLRELLKALAIYQCHYTKSGKFFYPPNKLLEKLIE